MQQNEEENVVKEELQFANDVAQFHTSKKNNILCHKYARQRSDLQGT
jgi:hypothetical protein